MLTRAEAPPSLFGFVGKGVGMKGRDAAVVDPP